MAKPSVSSVSIKKLVNDQWIIANDLLAVEEPLEIRLGFGLLDLREEIKVSVTMRTPGNDFDLAVGFLFTEGIIAAASDILSVKTTPLDIEDYPTFIDNLTKEKPKRKSIRSHYAVDFATQKINTAKYADKYYEQ